MHIRNTQSYTIKKSSNGYIVRRIIHARGLLSAPVEINLPEQELRKKYKNYSCYCNVINRLIEAELQRIASQKFNGGC